MLRPSAAVEPALRAVLNIWAAGVQEFIAAGDRQEHLHPLGGMSVSVSLLDPERSHLRENNADLVKLVENTSFARLDINRALQSLLETDLQLKATCRTPWGMAVALEQIALDGAVHGLTSGTPAPSIDRLCSELLDDLFLEEYRRGALFHLYNVDLSSPEIVLGTSGVSLVRITTDQAALITNEATTTSRLHGEDTGNAFVRFVDSGTGDDWAWMSDRWGDAHNILRVLRYLKYGVADLDWGGVHYSPEWVNRVRKFGLSMMGRPRWDVQPRRFTMDATEQGRFLQYLNFYLTHLSRLDDMTSPLRKATAIAGNYYESHHTRTADEDKLIDLVISTEALFSPGLEGELKFRIAQRGALLLGAEASERRRVFKLLRRAYDARSALVHGGESPFLTGKFSPNEIA